MDNAITFWAGTALFTMVQVFHYLWWGCVCVFSRVWRFATPWTVALQAPLSMGSADKNIGMHALLQEIFISSQ